MAECTRHHTCWTAPDAVEPSPPFTADDFGAQALGAALSGWGRLVHVQVRFKRETFCGVAYDAFRIRDTSQEYIRVRFGLDDKCFSSANVRQCSGLDGRCLCAERDASAPHAVAEREARAACGAVAVPLGNTGTTVAGARRG